MFSGQPYPIYYSNANRKFEEEGFIISTPSSANKAGGSIPQSNTVTPRTNFIESWIWDDFNKFVIFIQYILQRVTNNHQGLLSNKLTSHET